jgi:hypothetical protein
MHFIDVGIYVIEDGAKTQQELVLKSASQEARAAMDKIAPTAAMERGQQDNVALARSAAKAFCATFSFPPDQISHLDGSPIIEPVSLERDGRPIVAYRWLGGGRGGYYVQVEVYQDNNQVVVYGGYSHQEFGPWDFESPTSMR